MAKKEITEAEVTALFQKLDKDARDNGYFLNPDTQFTKDLVKSLLVNQQRYGYQACPCRLAEGRREEDLDIICPCDYRDADLSEHDACFCALYVSKDIAEGRAQAKPVPERRPPDAADRVKKPLAAAGAAPAGLAYPVWRCTVCGYLAARPQPPAICPICKVTKDRFERFM